MTTASRISAAGFRLADVKGAPIVCVALRKPPGVTETFIRAHLEHLPARVECLCGESPEAFVDEDGRRVAPGPGAGARLHRLLGIDARGSAVRAAARHLKQRGAAAVLAEFGGAGLAVLDVCREAGLPLVVHFHGADAYQQRFLSLVLERYARLFEAAAALLVVSRDMERQLVSLGAPRGKVRYCPYGVDLARFAPVDPAQNPPHFVAVGRLVDKKAPDLTLLAFSRAAAAVPGVRLTLIGDGPLAEACRRLARGLGVEGAVSFRGECSHEDVARSLREARALVQHSVRPAAGANAGDSEGTPLAVIEAGASGLPVVATRHGGIPDAVVHGETGFLVEEGDVDGMARHMADLARDPALASRLGAAARARVAERYSQEPCIARLWSMIAETLP